MSKVYSSVSFDMYIYPESISRIKIKTHRLLPSWLHTPGSPTLPTHPQATTDLLSSEMT